MKNPSERTCRLLCLLLLLSAFAPVAIAQAPTSGWSHTGCLNEARAGHTATLLPNGKVLVVGGGPNDPYDWTNTAELYDPATGTWCYTASPSTPRRGHTATLLTNGKVLVAGGEYGTDQRLNSAEFYDPATGAWTATGNLNSLQFQHSATLLANGKVLVVGFMGLKSMTRLPECGAGSPTPTRFVHSQCRRAGRGGGGRVAGQSRWLTKL